MKATENILLLEVLTAVITRLKENPLVEIRNVIKKKEDLKKLEYIYVGLSDVYYSYRSTTSKLLGNYFKKAINSSILYPEKEISDLEKVLRE
jgi:hypothetical protein